MDVSILELEELDRELLNKHNSSLFIKNFYDNVKRIKEDETTIISSYDICPTSIINRIKPRLTNIDFNKLAVLASTQFYNHQLLTILSCVINSIVGGLESAEGLYDSWLHLFVHNLKRIGENSIEGDVFLADVGEPEEKNNLLVLKVAKKVKDDYLIHELFVGVFGTNKLRKYIPNFAYVFGGFKCTKPIVKNGKFDNWCSSNYGTQLTYIAYENIYNSISFEQYVESCTEAQFLSAYLQILYSLRLAHREIDYTHYDLHQQNILMRPVKHKKFFHIIYQTENGKEYLLTDRVATIIDYGFSHIKYKNKHYGTSANYIYVDPGRSWIYNDAYKLLMHSMSVALTHNQTIFPAISKIFRFFNREDDPLEAINKGWDSKFYLPVAYDTEKFKTLDPLIKYIRLNTDCYFVTTTKNPKYDVLSCGESSCMSNQQIFSSIGLNQPIKISDTFVEYRALNNKVNWRFAYRDLYENVRKTSIKSLNLINYLKEEGKIGVTFESDAKQTIILKLDLENYIGQLMNIITTIDFDDRIVPNNIVAKINYIRTYVNKLIRLLKEVEIKLIRNKLVNMKLYDRYDAVKGVFNEIK